MPIYDDHFVSAGRDLENIPTVVLYAADTAGMRLNTPHFIPRSALPKKPVEEKKRVPISRRIAELEGYTVVMERYGKDATDTYTIKLYKNVSMERRQLYASKTGLDPKMAEPERYFAIVVKSIEDKTVAERRELNTLYEKVHKAADEERAREAARPKSLVEQIVQQALKQKPPGGWPKLTIPPTDENSGYYRIQQVNDSHYWPRQIIKKKDFENTVRTLTAAGKKPPVGEFSSTPTFKSNPSWTQSQINLPPGGIVPGPMTYRRIDQKKFPL